MTLTYGELKQAIQDYCEYDETSFVNNLPLFIRLAEERIFKNVRLNVFQKNVGGTLTSGNQYLAAPTDFLSPFSLSLTSSGSKVFLDFKDLDFVQTYTPNPSTTGEPKYFAQFDVDNFVVAPTPDASYTVDLHYLYRPASLTAGADSGTTWLSQNSEMAILYGSLVEAYTYMKGEANLISLYNSRFMEALSRLKNLGEGLEPSTDYRDGRLRVPRS
jgi:hypothetical protein